MQDQVPDIYRGVRVPTRLRRYWNKPTGRWWRAGVDAKADMLPVEVLPGQVYEDGDYRKEGRTLRVDGLMLDGRYANCTILTNYRHVQEALDKGWTIYKDMRGCVTVIKTRRLYPNARGYRLLSEPGDDAA
jgi:hypothetical protein